MAYGGDLRAFGGELGIVILFDCGALRPFPKITSHHPVYKWDEVVMSSCRNSTFHFLLPLLSIGGNAAPTKVKLCVVDMLVFAFYNLRYIISCRPQMKVGDL